MTQLGSAYSADVALWLECEHGQFPLAQVSRTFVVPATPQNIPPCNARVVVSVDGRRHEYDVLLVDGLRPDQDEATILANDQVAPF